jgi:hypothetical protein
MRDPGSDRLIGGWNRPEPGPDRLIGGWNRPEPGANRGGGHLEPTQGRCEPGTKAPSKLNFGWCTVWRPKRISVVRPLLMFVPVSHFDRRIHEHT